MPCSAMSCTARFRKSGMTIGATSMPPGSKGALAGPAGLSGRSRRRDAASSSAGTRPCRLPGRPDYPVDQNEKFSIDGEARPSIEFQGMEDSFGFSWGFPPTESQFPLTGFFPFYKGAAAYRFFLHDARSASRNRSA